MRYIGIIFITLFFIGCAGVKKGDYVTYESKDYLFINDTFLNQKMDCLELGKIQAGSFEAKYCEGENYASAPVQGFIFKHEYANFNERFVGATLSFKTKDIFTIQCSSETINEANSGVEYINCMVPKRDFDLYTFIMRSPKDITGQFKAAVGEKEVYQGVIKAKDKELLEIFHKERNRKADKAWRVRQL